MQGPIDIQKQVRQKEEKRIYEPQPLMHLSPHFLAQCILDLQITSFI